MRRRVFGAVCVLLLSGCMTGAGPWHGDGAPAMGHMPSWESGRIIEVTQTTEASSGSLKIGLSFATPRWGEEVLLDATLSENGVGREPVQGEVRLSIRTPGGSVDQLRMEPLGLSQGATHRARYRFADAGLYQVTAEGRMGNGADMLSVSVRTETHVDGQMRGHGDSWLQPAALLGGLGMVGMMVLMVGGWAH